MSTKADLVNAVAKACETSKATAYENINAVVGAIQRGLKRSGTVQIKSFGTFKVVDRKARKGRNPKTGESIAIPASRTVKFKPSTILRDEVAK